MASAQPEQSLRCPHGESLGPYLPIKRTAKTLNESLLGTHATLLVLSRGGSYEQLNRKTFMPFANNKDADQPGHPRCLISIFVIHCLESRIPIAAIPKPL